MKKYFTRKLLEWYNPSHRVMPWKGSKNPYFVWLSEIILQQTRVEQGLPYFNHFVEKYPTVFHLAKASEDEILKLWQGLGYYSRARNLLATAKIIVEKHNGKFPEKYEELLKLKGVGEYTAAAISSFAFEQPYAVVDGNVFRVLARYFGIKIPIDIAEGKKYFTQLANELLNKKNPGQYNQAIMDFGASQCKPANPDCPVCPLKKNCFAFQKNQILFFPKKSKTVRQRIRYFNYLVIDAKNSFLFHQRNGKDIWKKLYEFPLIETGKEISEKELLRNGDFKKNFSDPKIISISPVYKQQLSHQKIFAKFWHLKSDKQVKNNYQFFLANKNLLTTFAVPKIIFCYLKDKGYF